MFPIKDTVPSKHPTIAVWVLILVNAVVFYFELTLDPQQLEQLFFVFGLVPARYTHPQWASWAGFPVDNYWPFVTSMFLHGGWLHIVLNMWTLWIFGDNIEDRMGTVRFLLFFVVCGIASLLAHWWANPLSRVPAIGASGAIAGVLGAYLVMFPRSRIIAIVPIFFYPLFIEIPAFFYLTLWFLIQLASGAMVSAESASMGGVAWWAHIGGFVVGVVLWPLFLSPRRRRRRIVPEEVGNEDSWMRMR